MTQPEVLDGLVIKEMSGFFWVELANGNIYMCRLRGKLMEEAQSADIAAIGDRVSITITLDESDEKEGVIETVAERKCLLSRSARTVGNRGAGQAEREHVIIANPDQTFFVFAATQPTPNFHMLDRFLVMGEKAQIDEIVIVVNKIDLEDPSRIRAVFAPYEAVGYPILYTSALHGHGIDEVRARLQDKISVFSGPSGVGKTSLLNRIQPDLGRAVKAVSKRREEGLHTTRDSALVKLEGGGYVADTPGLRTLSVWDVEPEELDAYFVEIAPHVGSCRFGDCSHRNEPACAVREAVEKDQVSQQRYQSYLKLREELEATYAVF